ncbi:MAG: glycosyltransferase family 2 protein [Parvibaculum sp.]|nr:glycosyltransferase family 2 protein [Parvibaculum sp.]
MSPKAPPPEAAPTLSDYLGVSPAWHVHAADLGKPGGVPGRVSIVTVCFNAATTLPDTIHSVLQQTYALNGRDMEYIVVDGGSADGTDMIVRSHRDFVAAYVSEPDAGISDAFNKGISLATGEYILLLNADDVLTPTSIEAAARFLDNNLEDHFCHGDLQLVDADGQHLRYTSGPESYIQILPTKMPLNHPTMFARRSLYERHGLYRCALRCSMDYDFIFRLGVAGVRGSRCDGLVAVMRDGGVSTRLQQTVRRESYIVRRRHGVPFHNAVYWRMLELLRMNISRMAIVRAAKRALLSR